MSRTLALSMTAAALVISTGAMGANPVPDKAAAFVAYCAGHFADCKAKVVDADVAALATRLFAKQPQSVCSIPKGVSTDAATKDILAWLGNHKIAAAMSTDDAIQAAVKDLWHCKTQIGDGTVPGGPPAKTGAFVSYCANQQTKCANEIVAVTVAVAVPDRPVHCSPPDDIKTKELAARVVAWLGQHKETHNMKTDDGIAAAFDHLWPCHLK